MSPAPTRTGSPDGSASGEGEEAENPGSADPWPEPPGVTGETAAPGAERSAPPGRPTEPSPARTITVPVPARTAATMSRTAREEAARKERLWSRGGCTPRA